MLAMPLACQASGLVPWCALSTGSLSPTGAVTSARQRTTLPMQV
jgi:hypothetical protein